MDRAGKEYLTDSARGFPPELNSPNFKIDGEAVPCDSMVCWKLFSSNSYKSGATVKITALIDRQSYTMVHLESDTVGGTAPGYYQVRYEYLP